MLTDEQRANGWIEHDGGPCPVPLNSRPRIMFVGAVHPIEPSGSSKVRATDWSWQWRRPETLAIIAYRQETTHAD